MNSSVWPYLKVPRPPSGQGFTGDMTASYTASRSESLRESHRELAGGMLTWLALPRRARRKGLLAIGTLGRASPYDPGQPS